MSTFYSNGKLLLTGEYTVLDGALSLAIPTKYGQSLVVKPISENKIIWQSLNHKGDIWFEEDIPFENIVFPFLFEYTQSLEGRSDISKMLVKILYHTNQINSAFLSSFIETKKGLHITTRLDFPNDWGLGTSSTLINNIANWAKVDPYKLLDLTFGGSGYDIACAQHDSPLTYQLNNNSRLVKSITFNPEFKANLFFVHLNRKQNSRDSIFYYNKNKSHLTKSISEINDITTQIIACNTLTAFEILITKHETIISRLIQSDPVKSLLFSDYEGVIKSLGGWGGDFILATSKNDPSAYFKSKGYHTVISYSDMILA